MKYYSDKTEKLYSSLDELKSAEREFDEVNRKKAETDIKKRNAGK